MAARSTRTHLQDTTASSGPGPTGNTILNAAIEVFSRLGFAAARVEDILEAAPVARRTFYKQFESKEGALAALYQFVTRQLLDTVRNAGGADPLDGVRRALDAYFDFHVGNARLLSVVIQQAVRSDSPLAPLRKEFRAQLFQLIDDAVFASTGEHHDRLVYVGLISALEGMTQDLLSADASAAQVETAKKVMRQLLERTLSLDAAPRQVKARRPSSPKRAGGART